MMEFRPSAKRKVAGWGLMGLGVIGLVLPFLQGFLFLVLGTFVLRHQYMWAHRGMGWVESRWPDTVARVEGMEARLVARATAAKDRLRLRLARLVGRG